MVKFGNFELSEAQRKILAEKNQRRNELRSLYWKNITDPHRHATGEGGHLVNKIYNLFSIENFYFAHNLMILNLLGGVMSSDVLLIVIGNLRIYQIK